MWHAKGKFQPVSPSATVWHIGPFEPEVCFQTNQTLQFFGPTYPSHRLDDPLIRVWPSSFTFFTGQYSLTLTGNVKMCGRGAVLFALTDNVNKNHERAARVKFLRCVVVGNKTPVLPVSDTGNKFRYRRTSNAKPCCANTNRVYDPVA